MLGSYALCAERIKAKRFFLCALWDFSAFAYSCLRLNIMQPSPLKLVFVFSRPICRVPGRKNIQFSKKWVRERECQPFLPRKIAFNGVWLHFLSLGGRVVAIGVFLASKASFRSKTGLWRANVTGVTRITSVKQQTEMIFSREVLGSIAHFYPLKSILRGAECIFSAWVVG